MTRKAFVLLVSATLLLAARHTKGADPGPLSFDERRHTTRLFEPSSAPPAAWYEAIEARPISELLQEEECYAVVRVEHGFNQGVVSGHYLVVTLSFMKPKLVVVSKSLKLLEDGTQGPIYSLWDGYRKDGAEELTDGIRRLLKTEKRTFMPGEGEHRGRFTSALNRLGIGTLPSVRPAADHVFIPVRSFVQVVQPDGTVRWRATFSGGGGSGYAGPVWRFSACWRRRDRENSHEFWVRQPFGINDLRYEKLLLEVAKHSSLLKVFLNEKYDRMAAHRAERAKRKGAKKREVKGRPVQETVPDARHATSEPQGETTTDSKTETQQRQANVGRGWAPAAIALVGGLALGGAGAWLLSRSRADSGGSR